MTEMQALQEMKFQPKDFEFAHESQELEKDEVMPARSAWKDSVSLFVRNKGAVIGIVLKLQMDVMTSSVNIFQ